MVFALTCVLACDKDEETQTGDPVVEPTPQETPEEVKYVVTFDVDGEKTTAEVKEGEKAVKPVDPVKEGYTFLGWYLGDALYDFETAVTAEVTLLAKFEEVIYTVTFDVDGSKEEVKVKYNEKAEKPADPVKKGYNFLGWYVGDEQFNFDAVVTSDVTIVAKFEEIKLPETVEEAVEKGVSNAGKVATGTAEKNVSDIVNNYSFAFGPNYTKVIDSSNEFHYELLENGTVFGVSVYSYEGVKEVSPAWNPTENNLLGVDFSEFLGYEYETFGVEALVANLYTVAKLETSLNFAEKYSAECAECGKKDVFTFQYEVIQNEFYYYYVTVCFTLDFEQQFINEVLVSMNGFYLESMIKDEETGLYSAPTSAEGEELVYDIERTLSVKQEAGERSAVNEYPAASLLIQSFDLTDAEGNAVVENQEFAVVCGNALALNVANITPETSNPNIDLINVTITDSEGLETWNAYGSYYDGSLTVTAYKTGVYTVVVSSALVSKTFVMNVGYAELTSFEVGVYNADMWSLVAATEANVYVGGTLLFGAVPSENGDAGYTYVVNGDSTSVTIDFDGEYNTFSASAAGTYELVLTSTANPELTATLTITVSDAPSVGDMLNGKYEVSTGMMGTITVVFTPESDGATKGTLTISAAGGYVTEEGTFTYEYTDGILSVVPAVDGQQCNFSVELDDSFNLVATYNYFPQGTLVKVEDSGELDAMAGTYSTVYTHPMNMMEYAMILVFDGKGAGTYSLMNEANVGTFEYAYDGTLSFSNFVSIFGGEVTITALYSESVIYSTVNFVADQFSLNLEFNKEDEEEGADEGLTGTFTAEFVHPMLGMAYPFKINFLTETTGTYELMNGAYIGSFEYSESNGLVSFTNVSSLYGEVVTLVGIYADGVLTCTTTAADGLDQTLNYTK